MKPVVPTEPTHHSVDVSIDTSKMPMVLTVMNVNLVDICVTLVKILMTTVSAHVQLTDRDVHIVLVQEEPMMTTPMPNVHLVTISTVKNVLIVQNIVQDVPKTETTI